MRLFSKILFFICFFSIVVCQARTTIEKNSPPSTVEALAKTGSTKKPFLKIIFDDSNGQLIAIDSSGNIVENAIVAFQLFVTIKGVEHSEQALGSSLNKAMLDLLAQVEQNTILYFEHIHVKNAAGNLVEVEDFQYTLGYSYKKIIDTVQYKLLKCGLYAGSNGDIAYQTRYDKFKNHTRYINWIYNADKNAPLNGGLKEMKFVIDTATFRFLNTFYWADKNNIYNFNPMSDGGTIYLFDQPDMKTFTLIGEDGYSKDKQHVYFKSTIINGADVKTFKIIEKKNQNGFAYDKFHIYKFGVIMSSAEIEEEHLEKYRK